MRRFLRENSLSIFFGILFLASLLGQSIAGWKKYNQELLEHDDPLISWGRYLYSSEFGAAVLENWQSEFLQFFTFILATIWFVQKGSNESKKLDEMGLDPTGSNGLVAGPHPTRRGWRAREGFSTSCTPTRC